MQVTSYRYVCLPCNTHTLTGSKAFCKWSAPEFCLGQLLAGKEFHLIMGFFCHLVSKNTLLHSDLKVEKTRL